MSNYKGKVVLIFNIASECGFTPQYVGLQKLYETFKDQGLEILAFSCKHFGGQEPGRSKQIQNFCKTNFGVTFPLFARYGSSTKPEKITSPFKKIDTAYDSLEGCILLTTA